MPIAQKGLNFIKKNAVLCIAIVAAVITSFIIPPDKQYVGYFDFKTLTWGSSSVRVGQWALLRHKATGRLVRVFNQHPDWKSQESRSKGMALVAEKAKQAISDGEDVIMVGDLNEMAGATVSWSPPDPDRPRSGTHGLPVG